MKRIRNDCRLHLTAKIKGYALRSGSQKAKHFFKKCGIELWEIKLWSSLMDAFGMWKRWVKKKKLYKFVGKKSPWRVIKTHCFIYDQTKYLFYWKYLLIFTFGLPCAILSFNILHEPSISVLEQRTPFNSTH